MLPTTSIVLDSVSTTDNSPVVTVTSFTVKEALDYFRPLAFGLFKRYPSLCYIMEIDEFISNCYIHFKESKFLEKYGVVSDPSVRICTKFYYLLRGMKNRAVDILREDSRKMKVSRNTFRCEEGEELSLYDVIPDDDNVDVLGELILQEAISVLPKDRRKHLFHGKIHEDHEVYINIKGQPEKVTVWFCHYWIYYLHLEDWSNTEIAELFNVSITRIHQILQGCRSILSGIDRVDGRREYFDVVSMKNRDKDKKLCAPRGGFDDLDGYFEGWVGVPKSKWVAVTDKGKMIDLDKLSQSQKTRIKRRAVRDLTDEERIEIGISLMKLQPVINN